MLQLDLSAALEAARLYFDDAIRPHLPERLSAVTVTRVSVSAHGGTSVAAYLWSGNRITGTVNAEDCGTDKLRVTVSPAVAPPSELLSFHIPST